MGMVAMLVMWPNSFVYIFIPILFQAFIWTLVPNRPTVFEKKQVLTLKSEWHLTKVKEWPWPLVLPQLQAPLRPKAAIASKKK